MLTERDTIHCLAIGIREIGCGSKFCYQCFHILLFKMIGHYILDIHEYMNRRGQYPAEKPQNVDTPPAPPPPTVLEAKESVPQTIGPAIADDAVGLSNFSVADLKAMRQRAVARQTAKCLTLL